MNADPEGAKKRIEKMIDIIYDEANDKARKTREQTAHQYNIEKNKILNQQKDKVIQEYKNKLENYSVQRKIERSAKVSASRLKKMQARQDNILKVKEDAKESIQKTLKDKNTYKTFLKNMIVQGLIRMMEKDVRVRARPSDFDLVESVLEEASKDFTSLIKRETGYDLTCKVTLEKHLPLTDVQCRLGGVVLAAQQGTILCNNTIDARLDLCYADSLPDVRHILFPGQH